MTINWGLLDTKPNMLGSALAGYKAGRELRTSRERENALAGVAKNEPGAMERLEAVDYELAAKIQQRQLEREQRSALSGYVLAGQPRGALTGMAPQPQRNALSDVAPQQPALGGDNVFSGLVPGAGDMGAARRPALGGGMTMPGIVTGYGSGTFNPDGTQVTTGGNGEPAIPVGARSDLDRFMPGTRPGVLAIDEQQAPPAAAPQPEPLDIPPPGTPMTARQAAWTNLARVDPEMAIKVRDLDAKSAAQAAETLGKQMDIGGRVMSAVLAAPQDQQAELYRQYREELEGAGVIDLPDVWDPKSAQMRMRMGMTVLQSLTADDRERRTDWYVENAQADNERQDRNTDSLIADRQQRREQTARRDAQASADRRYGYDTRGSGRGGRGGSRQPSKSGVLGSIYDKYARGEPLTPREQELLQNDSTPSRRRTGLTPGGGGGGGGAQGSKQNPYRITTPEQAGKLPKGAWFQANGKLYQRPQ